MPPHRVHPQWHSPQPKHELWQPSSWLGAYYKLRADDPVAMRSRDRFVDKSAPKRGLFILQTIETLEREKLEADEPWRAGNFKPGDYLQVEHRPSTGEQPDVRVGVLIGIHRRGLGSSIRLLCLIDGEAVESQYQLYSPMLVNVFERKPSEWRSKQRKLYDLRARAGALSYPAPLRATGGEEGRAAAGTRKPGGKKR